VNTASLREALINAPGRPTSASYGGPATTKAGAPARKFYYTFTIGENTLKGFHELLDAAEAAGIMPPEENTDE